MPPCSRKDREPQLDAFLPAHDQIARRAYDIHEQRGRVDGRDWEDWFQADTELRNGANHVAA